MEAPAGRRHAQPSSQAGAGTRPPTAKSQTPDPGPADQTKVDQKSIAVLPFANLSDDKDNPAFFSDGMHEDILTTLANIPEMRVISRTSVMEYRGTTKKIPQIAHELGVAYILEASVRRAGNLRGGPAFEKLLAAPKNHAPLF